MLWQIVVDHTVEKQMKRFPAHDAGRLFDVLQSFALDPFAGDLEKMKGESNVWRRRVGSYRVFYEVHVARKTVYVFDVKRRTSNTY
ncbi:type II toxin-antitoxin system RelE/ParE family toxin [Candidatus Uhrbacteria bacterium]|nr:type II toxin-antitoxin system RelE/ParE family toxin [Candidatus Uhrbacteria bacterium]